MLKKLLLVVLVIVSLAACKKDKGNDTTKENDSIAKNEMVNVSIVDFYTKAQDLVDKKIKITGIVDHVCKHSGKKIFLVADGATEGVHVNSEKRFDENLNGSQVTVIGIVREMIVDEAYCQKLDETNVSDNHEASETRKLAQYYRDSMATAGVDHLSFYSVEFIKFEE